MTAGRLLLGRADAAFLLAHVTRLVGWDAAASVRLVTRPGALGCYGAPPLGVLSFVAVPVAAPADPLDRTCAAVALRAALEQAGSAEGGDRVEAVIPDPVASAADLVALPPAEGWQLPMHAVAGDLVPVVDDAVAEFRRRSRANPGLADAIAAEIWDRPAWAGLPVRALHAARLLGFLQSDGARVAAATAGTWKRLTTARGQVFAHDRPAPGRLTLLSAP